MSRGVEKTPLEGQKAKPSEEKDRSKQVRQIIEATHSEIQVKPRQEFEAAVLGAVILGRGSAFSVTDLEAS